MTPLRVLWRRMGAWKWYALAGIVVVALAVLTRRRAASHPIVAPLLRRAHEAEVSAELARRRLTAEHEAEVQRLRRELDRDLGEARLREVDARARYAADPEGLVGYYRERARSLQLSGNPGQLP